MFKPIKLMDLELSRPIKDVHGLGGYGTLQILVRIHGRPIGYVRLPLHTDRCMATTIMQAILDEHGRRILDQLLVGSLQASLESGKINLDPLSNRPPSIQNVKLPTVTVAVCTRDRVSNLSLCLDALQALDYTPLEIMIVDNAPKSDATEQLVKTKYASMRYVREPRPGLDWARNRAIAEARGEIIAFTDDDVVVDRGWVRSLAQVFCESPEVMAVTGLVVPYELETEAQVIFENCYSFGKGFERKRYHLDRMSARKQKFHIRAGRFGTGANMAFRRSLFEKIGGFDPALDVGTITNGGGDLEMFFRVIQEGYTLIYEPKAIVRHRHRRDYAGLVKQMSGWGTGNYAFLIRSAQAYPGERFDILRFALKWLWKGNLRRLVVNRFRPTVVPNHLIWAQLLGSLVGLFRFPKSKRIAAKIAQDHSAMKKADSGRAMRSVPPLASTAASTHIDEKVRAWIDV